MKGSATSAATAAATSTCAGALAVAVTAFLLTTNPCLAGSSSAPLDTAAAKDLPQSVLDRIASKISAQTTVVEVGPEGTVRWSARAIRLIELVTARSPTDPDVYLYAMRYEVSVMRDEDSLAGRTTSCQAVVVYKDMQFGDPTVACEPIDVSRSDRPS